MSWALHRIDDRLIHGQVLVAWGARLDPARIWVVDDGVAASDNCGFLRYGPGDLVHLQFHASHPNDRAVFAFGVVRGSNGLAAASTLEPREMIAAMSTTPSTGPIARTRAATSRARRARSTSTSAPDPGRPTPSTATPRRSSAARR